MKPNSPRLTLAVLLVFGIETWLQVGRANAEPLFPVLGPPNMRFGTGQAREGRAILSPELPFPGDPESGWTVLQWRQDSYLKPRDFTIQTTPGRSAYTWSTPSSNMELNVHDDGGTFIYRLTQRDGFVESSGATDLFIEAKPGNGALTLQKDLRLELNARIVEATISFNTPSARHDGAVLAQVGATFRARFHDPATNRTFSVMIGVPMATSRDGRPQHLGCHFFGQNRLPQIVSELSLSGDPVLAFKENSGPPSRLSYSVSRQVCATTKRIVPCRDDDGASRNFVWPQAARSLGNWQIDSVTLGIETQTHFAKNGAADEGHVAVGFEISDIRVVQSALPVNECPD